MSAQLSLASTRLAAVAAFALAILAGLCMPTRAQEQECVAPGEAADGHSWIFVTAAPDASMTVRSLRYAVNPAALRTSGTQAGEFLLRPVSPNRCIPIEVPRTATTLYMRVTGQNVDRKLRYITPLSECRSRACRAPLVPVSTNVRITVAATGTLSGTVLADHGVDPSALSTGRLPRGHAFEATGFLTAVPLAGGSRSRFAATYGVAPEIVRYWTPPRADYVVVPTAELSMSIPSDWSTLRADFHWFRADDWLLGSEDVDPLDAVIALRCVQNMCEVLDVQGEVDRTLYVDTPTSSVALPPADLDAAPAERVRVEIRPVGEAPLALSRGTTIVQGRRRLGIEELRFEE